KTPLLIVTGGQDKRVPPQSAFNLRQALDDREMPYQWLYKAKEGHGFINPENKAELFRTSLAFIEGYLGI
ncbi:MAG: S9 family peptidase, partial [Psychrosphaera sp.]|nr:S9 family peptidase [Psychrosphaera sp.]